MHVCTCSMSARLCAHVHVSELHACVCAYKCFCVPVYACPRVWERTEQRDLYLKSFGQIHIHSTTCQKPQPFSIYEHKYLVKSPQWVLILVFVQVRCTHTLSACMSLCCTQGRVSPICAHGHLSGHL